MGSPVPQYTMMCLYRVVIVLLTSLPILLSNALRIAIVGAGPTGLLLVSRFLDDQSVNFNDLNIDIFEGRENPRLTKEDRSFAIGFNHICMHAVDVVSGLKEFLLKGER